jgi:hypothetical protein
VKIVLCYIVVTHGTLTEDFCARFVASYHDYPPGMPHDTLIICNGGPLDSVKAALFASLPNVQFYPRANDQGYDISGYIDAARGPARAADMMICLGESCYFHQSFWLARLADVWRQLGPGLYGSFSSNLVRPHLNTTGFVCPPSLLRRYPRPVTCRKERYEFEHGKLPIWKYTLSQGLPVRLVTWDGTYEPRAWRQPANILWRGDQSNCLMRCSHTDHYAHAAKRTQLAWARGADSPFR